MPIGPTGRSAQPTIVRRSGQGVTALPASGSDSDTWLTPAKAAALFGASPRTLRNWARAGKISAQRTLGGHRRYRESEVRALIAQWAEVAA